MPELISVKEARELLGLTKWQLRRRAKKGLLKRVELPNGSTMLQLSSVEAYAKTHDRGE